MDSNSQDFDALLERYMAGDRCDDVVHAVEAMAAEYPLLQEKLALLTKGVASQSPGWNTDASWDALRARIAMADSIGKGAKPARVDRDFNSAPRVTVVKTKSTTRRWTFVASAIAAACIAIVVARQAASRSREIAMQTVTTGRGEQRRLQLSDSSIVVMGPKSTLRYSIGKTSRTVELSGLANFTVRHDEHRPFVVTAGSAQATDLGTEFTVRAYSDEDAVSVTVASGHVAMSPKHSVANAAQLSAGDVGKLGATGGVERTHLADQSDAGAWTDGQIVFHNQTLRDVSRELMRWFDVEIAIPDSALARRRVEAVYTNASLPNILNALSISLGLHVVYQGKVVTLSRGVK